MDGCRLEGGTSRAEGGHAATASLHQPQSDRLFVYNNTMSDMLTSHHRLQSLSPAWNVWGSERVIRCAASCAPTGSCCPPHLYTIQQCVIYPHGCGLQVMVP